MNSMKYLSIILIFFFMGINIGCGSGDSGTNNPEPPDPVAIIPSNLQMTIEIEGVDSQFPDGDGSGNIYITATATDAEKYVFKFGDGTEYESVVGQATHTYTKTGANVYTVYVFAYSKTNHSASTFEAIRVYVAPETFDTLVFSDEFDVDGAPDDSKWGYNIGTGSNGWGNGEKQYYTDRSENVIVEGGFLKITAKKEDYEGSQYTSTRMLTQDKFEFTYGRVEVRAKLPFGVGTWPAIWMLGANIDNVGWPACGEIDIMEHWGHNHSVVQSALHNPSSYGDTSYHGAQTISDVSEAFHVYELYWNDEMMIFSVDGVEHYRYAPANKNSETWPYDANQFLILNIAMGGSWFDIDPEFVSSTLEIDYVRVYQ